MIPLVFRLASAVNILGVLIFSMMFTNERLIELSPTVCSRFGLVSIMLWGAAYLAVATSYRAVPYLVGVFAIEKFVYVATWIVWIQQHHQELSPLFDESPLTAIFYANYGPTDLLFGVFFAYVALRGAQQQSELPAMRNENRV